MKHAHPIFTRFLPAILATLLLSPLAGGQVYTGKTNPIAAGTNVTGGQIPDLNTAVQVSGTATSFTVGRPDGATPAPGTGDTKPTLTLVVGVPVSGIAISATVNANGLINTSGAAGGAAGVAGTDFVLDKTVINTGGQVTLARNNLATNTTINAGGILQLNAISATADTTTINNGGLLQVGYATGAGAIAKNTNVNGGVLAAMMYGSSSGNNGRGFIDGATINNGGQIWLGAQKTATAATYARNITINNGDFLIWNNVAGATDISNITVNAQGNIRVFGEAEQFSIPDVAPTVPMFAGATITNLAMNDGNIILTPPATTAAIGGQPVPPALNTTLLGSSTLANSGIQTFTYAPAKTLNIAGSYTGAGNFYLGSDLANNTGDKIILSSTGAPLTALTGRINIIATSTTAPTTATRYFYLEMDSAARAAATNLQLTGTVWYEGASGPASLAMTTDDDGNTLGLGINLAPPPTPWYENAAQNAYAAALAGWTTQLQTLQTRMGELRMGAATGAWINMNAAKYTVNAVQDCTAAIQSYGWQGGIDQKFTPAAATIYAGLTGSWTTATQNLNACGTGKMRNWSAGLYLTTLWNNGWYLDLTAKYQNQRQQTTLNTPLGTDNYFYNQPGATLSLETGKSFRSKYFVIQPQAQAAWFNFRPVDYGPGQAPDTTSAFPVTGIARYSMAASNPILTRLGIMIAKNADMKQDKFALPYARVSVINMSNTKNSITVTPLVDTAPAKPVPHTWTGDTDGTSLEGALGVNAKFNPTVSLYAELSARWGGKVEVPVAGTLGLRFNY